MQGGWEAESGSGKVCCNPLVMSAMNGGAGAGATVLSTCRPQISRASNMHPGSAGCLAWPSKPIPNSSLPFKMRKKILRSYSSSAAELGSEPRFQGSQFSVVSCCYTPFPSLLRLLGSSEWSFRLAPRCHISLGFGTFLLPSPLGSLSSLRGLPWSRPDISYQL